MRQLLTALTAPDFDGFERHGFPEGGYDVVTMTRYLDDQAVPDGLLATGGRMAPGPRSLRGRPAANSTRPRRRSTLT